MDLGDAARLGRSCAVMRAAGELAAAVPLAGWPVTPSGALRPAEVPGIAATLGLTVKPRVRRAADVPVLHRAWQMAVTTGMIRISGGRALPGRPMPPDDAALAAWLDGVRAICADLSGRKYPQTVQWVMMLALDAMRREGDDADDPRPEYVLYGRVFGTLREWEALDDCLDPAEARRWLAPPWPRGGDCPLFALLVEIGAVVGTASAPTVTELGRWVADQLRSEAPVQIMPDWPASRLLAQLRTAGPDTDLRRVTLSWRWGRDTPIREVLAAAIGTDAVTRVAAVRLATSFGDDVLPAMREVLDTDDLGPHARRTLWWWGEGPEVVADRAWLAVEDALAALTTVGPDEALSCLAEADRDADAPGLVGVARASGHAQAEELAQALDGFLRSGATTSIEQSIQVKVRLDRWRPTTWRRVVMPATDSLGSLHWVIAVLFGWGTDHLHVFEAGPSRYSDATVPLDGALDEDEVRLSRLFAGGIRALRYTYDLGACWEHEITLEKLVPRNPGAPALSCVGFAGDSPLEYPILEDDEGHLIDDPVVTGPFQLEKVNAVLASHFYDVNAYHDDDDFDDEENCGEDDDVQEAEQQLTEVVVVGHRRRSGG